MGFTKNKKQLALLKGAFKSTDENEMVKLLFDIM